MARLFVCFVFWPVFAYASVCLFCPHWLAFIRGPTPSLKGTLAGRRSFARLFVKGKTKTKRAAQSRKNITMKTDKNSQTTQAGLPIQTEQAPTATNYLVLSPDGLPVTDEPFSNKKAAEDFIPLYCQRFTEQGYYAAIYSRIPLNELPDYLSVVPIDSVWEYYFACLNG